MPPVNLAFAEPAWLLAAPLALLPLLRRDADTVNYSWLALVPRDPLSTALGWLLRIVAAGVMLAITLGLAGLHRPQVPVERVGKGAEIVLLLDRSRSMDEPLLPKGTQPALYTGRRGESTDFESKGRMARRLLSEFSTKRPDDLLALVLFSASPIPVMSFTQKQEMIQGAITAGGVGKGLSETDMGRGLLAAADFFDQRAYAGSRLILLVSDGGAQLEPGMRERLTTVLKRHRIGLYWIYIRSAGARGLKTEAGDSEAMESAPERSLHHFFQGLGIPYHAYEAEDPEALKHAIDDVGRLENLPIQYQEMLPRFDFATRCYAIAAGGCLLLFAAALMRVRRWP